MKITIYPLHIFESSTDHWIQLVCPILVLSIFRLVISVFYFISFAPKNAKKKKKKGKKDTEDMQTLVNKNVTIH